MSVSLRYLGFYGLVVHRGGGVLTSYLESAQSLYERRLAYYLPNSHTSTFLLLNTNVELEGTSRAVPINAAPVALAHNVLLLAV